MEYLPLNTVVCVGYTYCRIKWDKIKIFVTNIKIEFDFLK